MPAHGADPAALDRLAAFFERAAGDLDGFATRLRRELAQAPWIGTEAIRFGAEFDARHRRSLVQASSELRGAAGKLRRNAVAQRSASAAGGGSIPSGSTRALGVGGILSGGGWSPIALGDQLRRWSDNAGPFAGLFSTLDDVKEVPIAGVAGKALSGFGYFTEGYTIREELSRGEYVDAGLSTVFAGGDLVADTLKSRGTPLGYGGGVAVQTWTEVGRAARDVDWSAEGLQQIRDASLSDWGGAFMDSAKALPSRMIKIFSL
jgi:hypothetical protein